MDVLDFHLPWSYFFNGSVSVWLIEKKQQLVGCRGVCLGSDPQESEENKTRKVNMKDVLTSGLSVWATEADLS